MVSAPVRDAPAGPPPDGAAASAFPAADASPDDRPGEQGFAEIRAQLSGLLRDGRQAATTEIAYRKAQAAYGIGQGKRIGALLAGAALFAFSALMALVLGLLLSVATLVGPLGATGIVVGACLLVTMVCLVSARRTMRETQAALKGDASS